MIRFLGVFLCGFLIVSAITFGGAAPGHAVTPEGNETPEETRLKNARNFKQWRDSIPDLEKRLYDRVKGVNRRVIRVQNLVIGSFVLLLIFNGVFLTLIYRRIGTGGAPAATKPVARPAAASAPETSDAPSPAGPKVDSPADSATSSQTAEKPNVPGSIVNEVRGFIQPVLNLPLNIIRFIGKCLPRVVIAPDETPASGKEESDASLR